MDFRDYFKGKKVTVMGLGLLGRGVGDARYLAESGAEVIVTDLKSADELKASVDQLSDYENVTFRLGEHVDEDFKDRDFILVAAGVPIDSSYLSIARAQGIPLKQSAAWFAELSKVPIIGITGTRGKSTVTAMIHHVLTVVTGETVLLGGNVRGLSNLQLLNQVQDNSLCVMELDSWQLQGWGWAGISPQIAVFTNFMVDHMSYYDDNMEAYFNDKAQIFLHQEESGVLITTPDVFKRIKALSGSLGQEVILADASLIPADSNLAMPGEHNRLNAALAYQALKAVSLDEQEIIDGLTSFSGVEGRLQFLRSYNEVKIYNDNNATTPQATVEGLQAVGGDNDVVLIVGGTDKGIGTGQLPEAIVRHCAHVILYSGTGTEKLKPDLPQDVSNEEHATLAACVEAALASAVPGNTILFSPGYASFGKEYKNEYDRNDQFVSLIRNYEET